MASGSRSRACGSRTEAPSVDNTLITPKLNPKFEAMPGAEIIAYLSRSRRAADFDDATLVLAARERRLAEVTTQIREATKKKMELLAEICVPELKAANNEACARHNSSISGHRLTHQVGVIEEAYGEEVGCEVVEDILGARVIASHEIPKEEAQGEDVEASHYRGSQGEQPARATKKARKQKGATKKARKEKGPCFYNMVFNTLKEKEELQKKKWNEEAIAKEAAATASKPPYCKCRWSDAPYMPSKSAAVKEDSKDGPNDS